jgi:aconitate hydratase
MYLGVQAVIAKAIERIHQANLVNFGILPLTFADPADYDALATGEELTIAATAEAIASADRITVQRKNGSSFECNLVLAPRQRKILAAGGLLNFTRQGG